MDNQELEIVFRQAAVNVQSLPSKPSNEVLLNLYGLFKQASEGDVQGERPGGFDFKGMAKYDAWAVCKGKTKTDAMTEYVALVNTLTAK